MKKFEDFQLVKYFMFLVWPFATFLFSLFETRSPVSRNIIWLFCGYIGFTVVIAQEGMDMTAYKEWFYDYRQLNVGSIEFIGLVTDGTQGRGDYYDPVLSHFVGRFTDDHRILFMTYALFFGYFLLRNLWLIIEKSQHKSDYFTTTILVLLAFIVPVWDFVFRFYLAMFVFAYGLFLFYLQKQKLIGLIWILITYLIHIGFALAIGVFLIQLLLGKNKYFYSFFLLAAIPFASIDIPTLFTLLPADATGVLLDRSKAYGSEEYIALALESKDDGIWIVLMRERILTYTCLAGGLLLFLKGKALHKLGLSGLLSFSLLLYAGTFIMAMVPEVSRYQRLANYIILVCVYIYYSNYGRSGWMRLWYPFLAFAAVLYIVVEARRGLEILGVQTFFSNPVISALFESNTSVYGLFGK